LEEVRNTFPGRVSLSISARYGQGIEGLKDNLSEMMHQTISSEALPDLIPTLRQKQVFEQMVESLSRASALNTQGESPEFIALDLQKALEDLGSLIGATTNEEVLDLVFSRFCIGK
jgi:tRNA modification GTPase